MLCWLLPSVVKSCHARNHTWSFRRIANSRIAEILLLLRPHCRKKDCQQVWCVCCLLIPLCCTEGKQKQCCWASNCLDTLCEENEFLFLQVLTNPVGSMQEKWISSVPPVWCWDWSSIFMPEGHSMMESFQTTASIAGWAPQPRPRGRFWRKGCWGREHVILELIGLQFAEIPPPQRKPQQCCGLSPWDCPVECQFNYKASENL